MSEIASLASGAGSARVAVKAPGVVHVELSGFLEEGLYFALKVVVDRELERSGKLRVYFDSENASGFESAFRQRMMVWQASTRGRVQQIILLRSTIMAAAIAVANKITGGGAEITSNRARWEAALVDDVKRAKSRVRAVPLD